MKIYLKNSDEAHLADCRIRIKRNDWPMIPSETQDLVYQIEDSSEAVPEEAFAIWNYYDPNSRKTYYFWTDAIRLEKYFDKNPASWKSEVLEKIFNEELEIWKAFFSGEVYELLFEIWSDAKRMFEVEYTCGDCYGANELKYSLEDFIEENGNAVVCVDSDELLDELN